MARDTPRDTPILASDTKWYTYFGKWYSRDTPSDTPILVSDTASDTVTLVGETMLIE